MSILGWLFGKKKSAEPKRPSIAIPTPDDYPPELLAPSVPYERPPHRKGKRYTPEEREEQRNHENAQMLPRNIARHRYDIGRLKGLRVTHFKWRGCGAGSGWCSFCRKMDGKKFAYSEMPTGKAPGTFICDNGHVCRCYCEPVIS